MRSGLEDEVSDKVAMNPAGSVDPDSVAFFSPDEGGSYLHARGFSTHHVYKHITEHDSTALQYFLGFGTGSALWICSFESLFSKPCSKCGKLLAMNKKSALILSPLHRTYQDLPLAANLDVCEAYHGGCSPYDS
ncbi:unnamed protein product [Eruca vesicaria subsp. sativa]|uniref:Uncharacterized protein n=1 Tax=Eruca vesicaria subsp. sativa TaxID=29727 RepID=A0ABC8JYP6_ERUVS|nr:unnamed protein product [Eruca vesicaria subsp. sativa]